MEKKKMLEMKTFKWKNIEMRRPMKFNSEYKILISKLSKGKGWIAKKRRERNEQKMDEIMEKIDVKFASSIKWKCFKMENAFEDLVVTIWLPPYEYQNRLNEWTE